MVLVAITCTFNDLKSNFVRLKRSIENFSSCFNYDVFFYIVYQSKQHSISDDKVFCDLLEGTQGLVAKVEYFSVSCARNEAIKFSQTQNFTHLIFHDSSIVYSYNYLVWLKSNLSLDLLSTEFRFLDGYDFSTINEISQVKEVKFNNFIDIYICSYCFNLKNELPLFDELFGPGENSLYASGEDFLFLREYFKKHPQCRRFQRYQGIGIIHPPRPLDYSKHLAYAKGQGKIHQIYLTEEKSLYAVWRCLLFFGNAIFRVLIFRKSSLKILDLRIKGFFDCIFDY